MKNNDPANSNIQNDIILTSQLKKKYFNFPPQTRTVSPFSYSVVALPSFFT